MSWLNGPWRLVARLTHLPAVSQRRLWRGLIFGWALLLTAGWAVLSAFTRGQEKAVEEAGQMPQDGATDVCWATLPSGEGDERRDSVATGDRIDIADADRDRRV